MILSSELGFCHYYVFSTFNFMWISYFACAKKKRKKNLAQFIHANWTIVTKSLFLIFYLKISSAAVYIGNKALKILYCKKQNKTKKIITIIQAACKKITSVIIMWT